MDWRLLAPYLRELEAGTMTRTGRHQVVEERTASALWDGRRLPGPWLTQLAIDDAIERAQRCGTGTVVIRRSHHIACLAAYLSRATDRGFVSAAFVFRSERSERRAVRRDASSVHA